MKTAKEGPSRQRLWQIKKNEAGLCCQCAAPLGLYTHRCDDCQSKQRKIIRDRLGHRPRAETGMGRPLKGEGPDWASVDWSMKAKDIAKQLGVTVGAVYSHRKRKTPLA